MKNLFLFLILIFTISNSNAQFDSSWNNTNSGCINCVKNFPIAMFIYDNIRYPIVDSGVFVKYGAEKCAESFYSKVLIDSTKKEASTNFFGTETITVTRYKFISNGHLIWETVYGDERFSWFRFTFIILSVFIIVFLFFFFYFYKKRQQ